MCPIFDKNAQYIIWTPKCIVGNHEGVYCVALLASSGSLDSSQKKKKRKKKGAALALAPDSSIKYIIIKRMLL